MVRYVYLATRLGDFGRSECFGMIPNDEHMAADGNPPCLIIKPPMVSYGVFNSHGGTHKLDGLFHGTSIYKWMMTEGTPMTLETPICVHVMWLVLCSPLLIVKQS